MTRLIDAIRPCGPIADEKAAERARNVLEEAAARDSWSAELERAWPALAPVFGASSYLTGLVRRDPGRLRDLLDSEPQVRLVQRFRAELVEHTSVFPSMQI